MGLANIKALGLNSKNKIKWLIKFLLKFQYSLNLLHLYRMYLLVSMGCEPQEQLKSSLRKNLSLYSPIGAWLIIALVALAHKELEWNVWAMNHLWYMMVWWCCHHCWGDSRIVFLLCLTLGRSFSIYWWDHCICSSYYNPKMICKGIRG